MKREKLQEIIGDLRAGKTPRLTPADVPAFDREPGREGGRLLPSDLDALAASLTAADIPTFERALQAMDAGELAWLGFKVVYDAQSAQSNVDNAVTKKYGDVGSADGLPLVFFCNDAKEIVASREPSARDLFQMKDVTRGPSMHNQQFEGLDWASVALFEPVRVWLLGATDASSELSKQAAHVGFDVIAVDYDPSYLSAERFPTAKLILLEGDSFDGLSELEASPDDYVCVLTRGHMFDPEGCLWAAEHNVHYTGMMGCAGKNSTVHDLCIAKGMTEGQWDAVKRPIGLKFGAKTPAELAIAIVAELIDVRYRQRYPQEARDRHDISIGR